MNKAQKANDWDLLDKLTDAITEDYKDTAATPSVTTSKLRNGQKYISISTYKKGKKKVEHSAEEKDLHTALAVVVTKFLASKGLPSQMEQLNVFAKQLGL